ncbi:hypothetical protein AB0M87_10925 [Streptomyces sp. NPDC051320]|uniref:hypothetical protein n=1 Tax=Streptomyces sp. NPDC051320 TaxID=3154644 RepID=UPI0034220D65
MADERCEWLDKDMADRLLDGGPVGAVDDHARAQAARLYAALDGVARPVTHPENGEFPGEKLALEAFRQARAASPNALGPVRLGSVSAPSPPAGGRWRRPVWFGVAAAVAGCTLSGVAVAAGAGMLPSPFRPHEPMPASSVPAAATVSPPASPPTMGAGTSAVPNPGPGAPGTEQPGDQGQPDDPLPGGRQNGQQQDPGAVDRSAGPGRSSAPSGQDGTSPGGVVHGTGKASLRLVAACRDYRAGRVDVDGRQTLVTHAHGASKIGKFCARVLDGQKGGSSAGGSGGDQGDASFAPDASPSPSPSLPTASALASAFALAPRSHASPSASASAPPSASSSASASAPPSASPSTGHGAGASKGRHGQTDR